MKVLLKNAWFGPTEVQLRDRRKMSGMRFKRGMNDVPYELKDFLPKTAVIVDEEQPRLTLDTKKKEK